MTDTELLRLSFLELNLRVERDAPHDFSDVMTEEFRSFIANAARFLDLHARKRSAA
jgi:hypothetical protein